MHDDMLVTETALQAAIDQMNQQGMDAVIQKLLQVEPTLGATLTHNATLIAGKLALCGAPEPVVSGVHADLLASCVMVYLAVRRGSYEIWQDTAVGDRLLDLEVGTSEEKGSPPAAREAETRRQVLLLGIAPGRRTGLISLLRQLTGRSQRQVRQLLDELPLVLYPDVPAAMAAVLEEQLEHAGALVAVRPLPSPSAPSEAGSRKGG